MSNIIDLYQKLFMSDKEIRFNKLLQDSTPTVKVSKFGSITVEENFNQDEIVELKETYERAARIIEKQRLV